MLLWPRTEEVYPREAYLAPWTGHPVSWQIKCLNNKAELWLTVWVTQGSDLKLHTASRVPLQKNCLFPSPISLKGRVVHQWSVLPLLNYWILNLRLALRSHVHAVQQAECSRGGRASLWVSTEENVWVHNGPFYPAILAGGSWAFFADIRQSLRLTMLFKQVLPDF